MTKKRNNRKRLMIRCSPAMVEVVELLCAAGGPFDTKPYDRDRLFSGSLAWWLLWMMKPKISQEQILEYMKQANNDQVFNLVLAFDRAKRGCRGYSIDKDGIVHGANLKQEIIKG